MDFICKDIENDISEAEGWLEEAEARIASAGFDDDPLLNDVLAKIGEAKSAVKRCLTDDLKKAVEGENREMDRLEDLADGASY